LASTIIIRQKKYAFGTLLKSHDVSTHGATRTAGAQELELEKYGELALSLHELGLDEAYTGLAEDIRMNIEAQVSLGQLSSNGGVSPDPATVNKYTLRQEDAFMRLVSALLRTFFTNSVDVNLALTQVLISIAACIEIRLDVWFAMDAAQYCFDGAVSDTKKSWQSLLDEDEEHDLSDLQKASRRPAWSDNRAPIVYHVLQALADELATVRQLVPNLDQLISGRKNMLQAASLDAPVPDPHSLSGSPMPTHLHPTSTRPQQRGHSRASSTSSAVRGRKQATDTTTSTDHGSAASPAGERAASERNGGTTSKASSHTRKASRSIFQPPPPEAPSTTDVLMQKISFDTEKVGEERTASLNHVLTNVVVLQEFVLELVAVLQVRAAVLGEKEVRFTV
jgi:hypothetical protein